ncbi:aa3-type cytochrome c oxidase subunit IV [Sulfitobacter sp. F26204]|nr:aa3-type cytochrome c oxidase subunit IV [Sulfitobacter sp. F26204]MCX7558796.1 aa3-type cytochrome c oxidase subunit IV [Sulfitobacter sp. F26204]
MAEHEHGTMDTTEQENMFSGFVSFITKTVIAIIVLLILMAMFIR